jgi:hypothetical protein
MRSIVVKAIKVILVSVFLCCQVWFPLLVLFEYVARGNGFPFVTLSILMAFAILVMTLRDAEGEILFQDERGTKIGWVTIYGFGILKYLHK